MIFFNKYRYNQANNHGDTSYNTLRNKYYNNLGNTICTHTPYFFPHRKYRSNRKLLYYSGEVSSLSS